MAENSVEVIHERQTIVVRVTENGETVTKQFDLSEHAKSWADGQRIRLSMNKIATNVG